MRVPFGRGHRVGLIVRLKDGSSLPPQRLKRAQEVLDAEALLPGDVQRLLQWASAYYQHPPGEVFATAIPQALRAGRGLAVAKGLSRPAHEVEPDFRDVPPELRLPGHGLLRP